MWAVHSLITEEVSEVLQLLATCLTTAERPCVQREGAGRGSLIERFSVVDTETS